MNDKRQTGRKFTIWMKLASYAVVIALITLFAACAPSGTDTVSDTPGGTDTAGENPIEAPEGSDAQDIDQAEDDESAQPQNQIVLNREAYLIGATNEVLYLLIDAYPDLEIEKADILRAKSLTDAQAIEKLQSRFPGLPISADNAAIEEMPYYLDDVVAGHLIVRSPEAGLSYEIQLGNDTIRDDTRTISYFLSVRGLASSFFTGFYTPVQIEELMKLLEVHEVNMKLGPPEDGNVSGNEAMLFEIGTRNSKYYQQAIADDEFNFVLDTYFDASIVPTTPDFIAPDDEMTVYALWGV